MVAGPVAGGPWHDKWMEGLTPTIVCPLLAAGRTIPGFKAALEFAKAPTVAGIAVGEYHWHHTVRMWIWRGPDVPLR